MENCTLNELLKEDKSKIRAWKRKNGLRQNIFKVKERKTLLHEDCCQIQEELAESLNQTFKNE